MTPYEEDDDATLHRKLVAAKMARKRAEEDLKLLCNRIGLLKQEENKVTSTCVRIKLFRQSERLTKRVSGLATLSASVAATWKPLRRSWNGRDKRSRSSRKRPGSTR